MNNTFDFKRFGLLLRRQWLEFGKIYLITLGVALGVIVSFYVYNVWSFFREGKAVNLSFRDALFMSFGYLFITIVASNYFAHFGQKAKTVVDLLIPASTFEKMLTAILFSGFLSVISFIAVFVLTDYIFVTHIRSDLNSSEVYYLGFLNKGIPTPIYIIPFLCTAVFLLGSIYFNKFHYIKTAISVIIFEAFSIYVIINSAKWLTENRQQIPGTIVYGPEGGTIWKTILIIIFSLVTMALWGITYVRLKEKQV